MDITAEELKKRMDASEEINLLDVREQHEYDEDNLGGYLLPLGELSARLEELNELKQGELIVHCRSGKRSAKAREILEQNGFANVRNLEGGILAYRELE